VPQACRVQGTSGPFHVTARGNRGQAIFVDNTDRARFVELLSRTSGELRWTLDAYCLMTNHYHLVVEASTQQLSKGMQKLNARYAQGFNRRHDLTGHLFRHRFYAGLVTRDSHLLELLRYLALNPVHAGLCANPEDWRWGSYGLFVSGRSNAVSSRALAYFDQDEHRAREAFRAFVAAGS
jgi:REP element-mobilizing transposase RayT